MSQKINEVLSALIQEKKSIAAEIETVEKQRRRLLGTQKRIGRAIAALSAKSESDAGQASLSRDVVRKMVLEETKSNGAQSEQTIKKKIAAKLKMVGESRAGLTNHLRVILAEPEFLKEGRNTAERGEQETPS